METKVAASKTSVFKSYMVTYRRGSKLTPGTVLVWNYSTGSILSIEDPDSFGRVFMRWRVESQENPMQSSYKVGETIREQVFPRDRYRVEVPA